MINYQVRQIHTLFLCRHDIIIAVFSLSATTSRKNKYATDIYFMFKSRFSWK